MKSYDLYKECSEIACKYYDIDMELNCSFSDSNRDCVRELGKRSYLTDIDRQKLEMWDEMVKYIKSVDAWTMPSMFGLRCRILERAKKLEAKKLLTK